MSSIGDGRLWRCSRVVDRSHERFDSPPFVQRQWTPLSVESLRHLLSGTRSGNWDDVRAKRGEPTQGQVDG